MEKLSGISWDELKSQYYYHLRTLQNALDIVNNSTFELNRIYSEVIKKSRDTSPDLMEKFAKSWLRQINVKSINPILPIKGDYNKLLDKPTYKNYQDFGAKLQKSMQKNSIYSFEAYQKSMQSFYDTWMKMWSN